AFATSRKIRANLYRQPRRIRAQLLILCINIGRVPVRALPEAGLGARRLSCSVEPMKSLRILIVDDHEVVRRGLRSLLSSRPEWEIGGEAADGRAAVDQANSLRPDVILMDVSMPDMSGTQAAKIIHRELPETQVVIIS